MGGVGELSGGDQVVPRPPGVRPGEPALWSGWSEYRRRVGLGSLAERLAARAVEHPPALTPSAVLVPLYTGDGGPLDTRVILTRRSRELRLHAGEVSFPGGRMEPGESPPDTALRESHEEIGLEPGEVEILGGLEPLTTRTSASLILPLVGRIPSRPHLTPNPDEVAAILDLPLVSLTEDGVHHSELWPWRGRLRTIHFFDVPGDTIWGATAGLLHQLLVIGLGTG